MAANSAIEWTDATWNPIVGCSIVSPGCTNCYAMKMAARLERMGSPIYRGLTQQTKVGAVWNGKVEQSNWGVRHLPRTWRKPRRIFVNSMSDLFHEAVPDAWIDEVFSVMAACPQHTFQVLTKRAARMGKYMNALPARAANWDADSGLDFVNFPLPNVWLGVSVEDQARADERIPHLLAVPAAKRFLSCEPLLGLVRLDHLPGEDHAGTVFRDCLRGEAWHPGSCGESSFTWHNQPRIDLVICGGESGPNARPMHPDWARSLRDQCVAAGVPFFHKQNGEYVSVSEVEGPGAHYTFPDGATVRRVGKKRAGATLDSREWREMPT